MEIKSIDIKNIKGVNAFSFEPAKLNFITGPSGSGKSSIMAAIRYAVTGKTTENFAKCFSASCDVTADFARIGVVSRSIDAAGKTKVKLNGKTTTGKSITELFRELGVSMTGAGLATSSELLASSLGKELADYLLNGGFLKNDMTMSHLLSLNPLAPEVVAELKTLLPDDPAVISLSDIEAAYQQCRNARPALKTMAAEAAVLGQCDVPAPSRTSKQANDAILALQTKIANERKLAADYPKAKRNADELAKNIADVKLRLKEYESVSRVTERERKTADENKTNAMKLVDETRLAVNAARKDAAAMQKTLDALDTAICPISSRLICTTDKSSIREELSDAIQLKLDSADALERRLADYTESLKDARKACDALIQQDSEYKVKLSLTEQLERLEAIKITIPDKPDATVLPRLESELLALRNEADDIRKYENASESRLRAEALSEKLRITEILIKELAPSGGIRKQVLAHSIGSLEDWCNEQMKIVLPKYKLHFDPDDNFAVTMEIIGAPAGKSAAIAFESLSNGEQLRVIFVIMAMLNELNNTRIFLLDNLNALDINAFTDFLRLLETLESSYDHVFISGINHEGFTDAFNAVSVPHMCIDCSAGI